MFSEGAVDARTSHSYCVPLRVSEVGQVPLARPGLTAEQASRVRFSRVPLFCSPGGSTESQRYIQVSLKQQQEFRRK